jgi:hypothetical protein
VTPVWGRCDGHVLHLDPACPRFRLAVKVEQAQVEPTQMVAALTGSGYLRHGPPCRVCGLTTPARRRRPRMTLATGNVAAAEEATQEAFVRALQGWTKLSQHPRPDLWIMRTAKRIAIDEWRKRRREIALADASYAELEGSLSGCGSTGVSPNCPVNSVRPSYSSTAPG